jgi:hypothetical protein
MQPFIVSIVAGILFPVLPLLAELLLTDHVKPETLTITAVVYVAAIGLVSRHQAVAISSLLASTLCAVIYGGYESGLGKDGPEALSHINFVVYAPILTVGSIAIYSLCYAIERFGRHYIQNEPFLEF